MNDEDLVFDDPEALNYDNNETAEVDESNSDQDHDDIGLLADMIESSDVEILEDESAPNASIVPIHENRNCHLPIQKHPLIRSS